MIIKNEFNAPAKITKQLTPLPILIKIQLIVTCHSSQLSFVACGGTGHILQQIDVNLLRLWCVLALCYVNVAYCLA